MKQFIFSSLCLLALAFFWPTPATAQTTPASAHKAEPALKTYLIERDIPGAGQLSAADLKGISQKSCMVLKEMGPGILWVQSYVTGNKIFCVYRTATETLLREHAKKGGFPVTSITEIQNVINPKTAE